MPTSRSSRSRAVDAPKDLATAQRLIDQADRHIDSAGIAGVDDESRFGMLYDGARKSADAVLRARGRRVTHGIGHHIAYLAEAKRLLGADHEADWTVVQAARATRNDMEYRARDVSQKELSALETAAKSLAAAARALVEQSA